jgi:hypothetical protein
MDLSRENECLWNSRKADCQSVSDDLDHFERMDRNKNQEHLP